MPDAIRQQAITWAIVDTDLYDHMASLDHNNVRYNVNAIVQDCSILNVLAMEIWRYHSLRLSYWPAIEEAEHKSSFELTIPTTYLILLGKLLGVHYECSFNWSPPGQNGRLFADDIFRCIFVNKKIMYFGKNFIEVCS